MRHGFLGSLRSRPARQAHTRGQSARDILLEDRRAAKLLLGARAIA